MTRPALILITGSSRGMGEAMALQSLQAGHHVLGLARLVSPLLAHTDAPGRLEQWTADLREPAPVAAQLRHWLGDQDPTRFSRVVLINNAGVMAPPRPVQQIPAADTVAALRVGLEACVLLSAAFLAATEHWALPRQLLNISSGLGQRPMVGSAPYCAAKAGMDHFTRALALEQAAQPHGAKVVSLAPGVIDTEMQAQLRDADPAQFPDRANFVALQAQGQLLSPEAAARRVLAYLDRPDFGQQPVADVRQA